MRLPCLIPLMLIGLLQFHILIRGSESLKDKRRVVLSLKDRLHREHMVAVAEVGDQGLLNSARLGLAFVGSDSAHVSQTLDRLVAKLREIVSHAGDMGAELGDVRKQLIYSQDLPDLDDDTIAPTGDVAKALAQEMLIRATET